MTLRLPRLLLSVLVLALVLSPWLAGGTLPVGAEPAQVPEVTADGVVVWDDASDQILYTKNPHQRFAPASITKIMTAVLAIERGDLDEIFPIEIDAGELAIRTDSTTMGLYPGEQLSLRNLLYGLMLPSGNDAAIEIARHIGGTEAAFVDLMNAKAAELGLNDTHYMNPHGLDDDQHYTSAYDMTVLGRYAMQLPALAEIVGTRSRVFYGYDARKLYQLLNLDRHIERDGYDGIKIGYTENALGTYVGTAQRNGRRLYVTLLHSRGWARDGERLFDYFFNQPAPPATAQPTESAGRASAVTAAARPGSPGVEKGSPPPAGSRAAPTPTGSTSRTGTGGPSASGSPSPAGAARAVASAPARSEESPGLLGRLVGLGRAVWHRFQS